VRDDGGAVARFQIVGQVTSIGPQLWRLGLTPGSPSGVNHPKPPLLSGIRGCRHFGECLIASPASFLAWWTTKTRDLKCSLESAQAGQESGNL
jgi:hypothetical protein